MLVGMSSVFKKLAAVLGVFALLIICVSSSFAQERITIFAAASVKDALDEIVETYQSQIPDADIKVSYASSGVLARQIEEGAPADIYISANKNWMDYLLSGSMVRSENVEIIAENSLVIAVQNAHEDGMQPEQLLTNERFAMGDPAHVPAGIYGKQAIQALGLWKEAGANAIYGENVRLSLLALERGEVGAAITYYSDVLTTQDVKVGYFFSPSSHDAIIYPAALINPQSDSVAAFFQFLGGPGAKDVFEKRGFGSDEKIKINTNFQPPIVDYSEIILLSLRVAFVAMLFAVPLAFIVAYFLARTKFRGKAVLQAILMLPLVMPPVVTGYLLLLLFGKQGAVGKFLSEVGIDFAFQWTGAALAAGLMAFPLLVRPIQLSIENIDDGLDAAAKTLGAGFWTRLRTIILPLSWPGIIAGAVLGFAKALGEFGATITFVSNIPGETQTLSLAIYSLLQSPSGDNAALTLIIASIVLAVAAVLLSEWFSRRFVGQGGREVSNVKG